MNHPSPPQASAQKNNFSSSSPLSLSSLSLDLEVGNLAMAISCSTNLSADHRQRCSHRLGGACRKPGLRRRCQMVVKQQKTRFYILGRCISMLLCWHSHTLSD
ncbi:hypothetical protein Taro_022075 [Colocasia esculenta]|uniref:Uncharacterized protein n=1 Tax=Colocasia esculenta TaxID=4460 RepID=A0A843V0V4_COLES|nr:hypothetical protein [Colocasia esculenta]